MKSKIEETNDISECLDTLCLEMAKYNMKNNLESLRNDIEIYNKNKISEKHQRELMKIKNNYLKSLKNKNSDNKISYKKFMRYNSSKIPSKIQNNDISISNNNISININDDSFDKKQKNSYDLTKNKFDLKTIYKEYKEDDIEITLSSIKNKKKNNDRRSIEELNNNDAYDKNFDDYIKNINLNDSLLRMEKNKNDLNNIYNENEQEIEKKLNIRSSKTQKKVAFKEYPKKYEIYNSNIKTDNNNLNQDLILKKNSDNSNGNKKNNEIINTKTYKNNNIRASSLKNYNKNNQINKSATTKEKRKKDSLELIKEKITLLNKEKVKKEPENVKKFIRSKKRNKTITSVITSPLIITSKIKDEEFLNILKDDDFSLCEEKKNSFTKDNIGIDLLNKNNFFFNSFNNNEYNNDSSNFDDDEDEDDDYYSSKNTQNLNSQNSFNIENHLKNKDKEIIIEQTKNMKKYRICSSFFELQMKRLQIKNNNINKLKKKLAKKNNIILLSPQINSLSKKIIEQKGKYIPLYKRAANIQYEKNLKKNLFDRMKIERETKIENKVGKGHLSFRERNSNEKIEKFFESQISWKEKINSKTKELKDRLSTEKEKKLNEELIFRPKILNNSEYLSDYRNNKNNDDIFMKLYEDKNIKEKKYEKLKKRLTPSFIPNINDKKVNYYNNHNIFNNYSKFNKNNNRIYNSKTSRLINNISSNLDKLKKILIYEDEEELSCANLLKKNNYSKKSDSITSYTRLGSDYTNNKFPNINESDSIYNGNEFIYPDTDRKIIFNYYNNIKNNYINNINKNSLLKNKFKFQKQKKLGNNKKSNHNLSFLKKEIFDNNESIDIKTGKFLNKNNIDYEKYGKISKVKDYEKEEINNSKYKKEEFNKFLDLWNYNKDKKEKNDEISENDFSKKEYSYENRLNTISKSEKEEENEIMNNKDKNIKSNIYHINYENSTINSELNPFIIKNRQNIFYKYFRKEKKNM